jgi:DNA mismatch repair protein MutS
MTETQAGPKLTPMMEQYRAIQKTLPEDTILFFRLGDFYEMFFEDAVRASEILSITLTGREGGESGRIPMCGIPYHAFQAYIRTLVEHNLKVAICEQVGDPKASKGLVERKVTRIISPATFLDDMEKNGSPEYMTAVVRENGQCAMAYLDLGTGEFFVKEMDPERLLSELTLLSPREVILSKSLSDDSKLESFIKEGLNAGLTLYEDWIFDYEEGSRLLKESFKLVSEKSLSFHHRQPCVRAAGAILYYLRDHLHSALGHVRMPSLLAAGDYMVLDREAQKSLELVSNLNGRKENATLLACLDQTLTSMGTRTLYHWVTHPLLSVEEIHKRQDSVEEFRTNSAFLQSLRHLFKGVKDMERTLSRLNYGVANARDLVNLKLFLERVPELRELLGSGKAALLKETAKAIVEFPNIKDLIGRSIIDEPPLGLKDGGLICDGYHAELDELRQISSKGKSWILEFEKREIERTGIRSLKVKYSNVFGYTIEISNSNKGAVPPEYTRKQTLANAERFIVPELITWDEKISGAQDKIKLLEYQLFNEVRAQVLAELGVLQTMAKAVGVLDALGSLAIAALQKNWVRPEVSDSDELVIKEGRHPVVEAMLAFGQFVENDTVLDRTQNQLIVLTGPNMAGKSTYIRQVAQIVLMAQIGSFVPAASAKIGLVDRIFTRIGAADNLAQGESTFMVEMLETAHILQSATSRSLLILDEVGRGTSTFDGVSIAWAICEHLAQGKHRPRTLFATHYHELTQLEDHFEGIKNYNILVRETKDGIVFLRKVVRGGTDRSYGIHVARLAGIPAEVTKRAEQILGILESENDQATEIIESKQKKVKREKIQQPSFFDLKPESNPILDEIRRMAIENMTPLQALTKLVEIQERLKGDS